MWVFEPVTDVEVRSSESCMTESGHSSMQTTRRKHQKDFSTAYPVQKLDIHTHKINGIHAEMARFPFGWLLYSGMEDFQLMLRVFYGNAGLSYAKRSFATCDSMVTTRREAMR